MEKNIEFYREILLNNIIGDVIIILLLLIIPLVLFIISLMIHSWRKKSKYFLVLILIILLVRSIDIVFMFWDMKDSSIIVLENVDYYVTEDSISPRRSIGHLFVNGNRKTKIIVTLPDQESIYSIYAPNIDIDNSDVPLEGHEVMIIYAKHSNRLLGIE